MTNPNDDKAMSPKANEGKALTAEEAIGWTRIRLSNLRASQMEKHLDTSPCCRSYFTQPDRDKDLAALATLEALAEENAALKCREQAIPERDK